MTPRWTPTLDDFVDLACVILNASPDAVRRLPRIALAFLVMARFLDANGLTWGTADVGSDASAVERIAAGELGQEEVVAWIRSRTVPA